MIVIPAMPPGVDRVFVQGRVWWDDRQPRERLLILGLALVIAVFVLINAVWRPVQQARHTALTEIALYDSLAVQLRAAGPGLRAPTTASTVSGPPQTVITTTAGESALTIREIQQDGAETRVVMDAVDFARMVQWLDRLDREAGLSVSDAQLERQTAPGVVNARLTLVKR